MIMHLKRVSIMERNCEKGVGPQPKIFYSNGIRERLDLWDKCSVTKGGYVKVEIVCK
jgi:hypothetical protein